MSEPRKRRLWKTFFIPSDDDFNYLSSAWQSSCDAWGDKRYVMYFEPGIGLVETNLPLTALRALFRFADIKWHDYVSDTKPTNQEEGAQGTGKA